MLRNLASEVVLIDINSAKQEGEIMDMDEGLCFVETGCVRGASYKDAADADIVVITAGLAQKPGETRLDLVKKNREIMTGIIKSIGKFKDTAIVIVVSNPVDVLTHLVQNICGLPPSQVFGTGTALDTVRLRTELGHKLGLYAQSVEGFVLGEHGDSGFVAWSTVSAGSNSVKKFGLKAGDKKEIENKVRGAAYEIINRKGATYYGIAIAITDIVEAILFDQHKILPLSIRLDKSWGVGDICLGIPAVVGRGGVEKAWPIFLDSSEKKLFKKSAEAVKKYLL